MAQAFKFSQEGTPLDLYRKNYQRYDSNLNIPDCPLLFLPTKLCRELDLDCEKAGIPKETPEGKVDFKNNTRKEWTKGKMDSKKNTRKEWTPEQMKWTPNNWESGKNGSDK